MPGSPEAELVEAVRSGLESAADPDKAPQMQRYMKSAMPFRGVPATPLRRLCRGVFDAHPLPDEPTWRRAVLTLWDEAAYREERYAAIALTGHRLYRAHQRPDALDLYRHLVVTGAWWDYVDQVASDRVGPLLRAFPDEVTPVVRAWSLDDDLWLRRTAVICQLGSKASTDVDLLAEVIEANLADRDFFLRKAIGWALRQHARIDPSWVQAFVAAHPGLSALSVREALKHVGSGP